MVKMGGKKFGGSVPHQGLIWAAWLLADAGFAILLGGVASLQKARKGGLLLGGR